jgi:prolyl-tRNA synthetase
MVLTDAGEDEILYCDTCEFCVNVAIAREREGDSCPKCKKKGKLAKATASEVGNVFDLGQKYGKDFDLTFLDQNNEKKYPVMGCYGVGISRLMGVIVEKCNDEKGILWPESVAPFRAHLLELKEGAGKSLYDHLQREGIEVLYDEREASAGEKFVDADLLGIPWRLVVSEKTGDKVEIKKRTGSDSKLVTKEELVKMLRA